MNTFVQHEFSFFYIVLVLTLTSLKVFTGEPPTGVLLAFQKLSPGMRVINLCVKNY